ncbi:M67 family metallopeptidase [Sphingomonas sp. CL5.1]|uniref:Mov34/MPN/PAD-1 family protein n=1 Tax=Sphingomonas sp. CL5.1 TaxID=2653203 RepID=UPI001582CC3D|nr:M67 family metallopeptidase [Sphingomonas sp. CL5.1]QKS02175.1 M67 family metallopeptidase [Sphingomonas sp. CL5.1]
MTLRISRSLLRRLVAEAGANREEICGLLLRAPDGSIGARPCANVHPMPATRFELDPAALLAAHRAARMGGDAVIGHYHSHPSGDAMPSRTDAAQAADGAIWLIVAGNGEARAWRAVGDGAVHGRFDPLTILIDEACA